MGVSDLGFIDNQVTNTAAQRTGKNIMIDRTTKVGSYLI
jgi:hypothetical protein